MLKGKQGQATNIILFTVIIFFLVISLTAAIFVNDKIADVIKTNSALNSTSVAGDITDKLDTINSSVIDNTFAFIAAILIIGMMISGFLSSRHPAWFFLYIIVLAVAIFTAAPLANTYQLIIENPSFAASVAANQPAMNYFMTNYIKIIIVAAIASIIVALSSPSSLSGSPSDI